MSLSSFFQRARSSATGSADSSRERTEPWLSSEDALLELMPAGQSYAAYGSRTSVAPAMLATMPATKQLVAKAAIENLFRKDWFDITVLRHVCELAGASTRSPAYNALQALHCVHYDTMPDALKQQLPHLVREALLPPPPRGECVATGIATDGVVFSHG